MKKKWIVICLGLLLLIAGGTFGVVHHNNVIHAQQVIEQQKSDLNAAKTAVETAYKTRKDEDIKTATKAINKLTDKQKDDKKKLTDKMTKLADFIKQITAVNEAYGKAEKSKADTDIKATQVLIDKMTDGYLSTDKATVQKKLADLTKKIKDDKSKADKEKAEAEAKAKAEAKKVAEAEAAKKIAAAKKAETIKKDQPQQTEATNQTNTVVKQTQQQPQTKAPVQQQTPAKQTPKAPAKKQASTQQQVPAQQQDNRPPTLESHVVEGTEYQNVWGADFDMGETWVPGE